MRLDVLVVGSSFPLPMGGGSINYIYNLLKGLEGLNCTILTAKGNTENNDFDSKYPFKIIRSKYIYHILETNRGHKIKRYFNLLMSILFSMKYIIKKNPKIVYFTEFSFLTAAAFLANPFCKSEFGIFTYSEELQQCIKRNIHRRLMKKVFQKFDIIVTVCEYTRDFINSFGCYNQKIFKIIPPISVIEDICLNDSHVVPNKIKLLTVGRLEERKGHIDVIKALSKLYPMYPNIEYNIVGVGKYEMNIKKAITKYGAEKYTHLLGKLSDVDLRNIYINSHIFLMPHKQLENGDTEGCPTVFLEASYYKLPVIGGSAGGVSDAIIHGVTGYILRCGTEDLCNYLTLLFDSKSLRNELGNKGHDYACQFVVANQAKKFREITNRYI